MAEQANLEQEFVFFNDFGQFGKIIQKSTIPYHPNDVLQHNETYFSSRAFFPLFFPLKFNFAFLQFHEFHFIFI